VSRVAVVIPTYNDGELAVEAVRSIDEAEPVEVVVVDDGSTDPAAVAALDGLERDGVRVVRQPNAGLPAARSAGVEATTAPLILPLDADDLLVPGSLGALADQLEAHPDAGFAWGDYEEFGVVNRRVRAPRRFLPWSTTYVHLYVPTILLRRDVLDAVGRWPHQDYEDWGLMLAFAERGVTGVYLDRITFRRRIEHGRMLPGLRRNHRELYAGLQRRYPQAFARRRELARIERPALWQRVAYPLVFGRRLFLPADLETRLRRSPLWGLVRPLRR
jgi:glycosyltransferase involved in cell wall biosynthesis